MGLKIWGCKLEESGDSCGHENETLGPEQSGYLNEYLSGYCLLRRGSAL